MRPGAFELPGSPYPEQAALDLADPELLVRAAAAPWDIPERYWPELDSATAHLDGPFAAIHLPALAANAHDLLRRAGGMPIRVASKSIRIRSVIDAVLRLPGYRGVLAYTLAEALWLATDAPGRPGVQDVVVGYPTVDRAALGRLAADEQLAARVTLMIDSEDQLDLVDAVVSPAHRPALRVALELDASFRSALLGHVGVWRSPLRTATDVRTLAERIAARPGFRLVGAMSYEAQIAGVGDQPIGRPFRARILRAMQRSSAAELAERRGAAIAALREVAKLEFVNGGGTGSLESTAADASVTELAAGSGLIGPRLFDNYARFRPAPAAAFPLGIVRRPKQGTVTVLGGGWIASGPASPDRLPQIVWPDDLEYEPREAAGEVQTPLHGASADRLRIGDRVWFRHTKAGELFEHVDLVALVDEGRTRELVPSYRGEGQVFL